MTMTNAFETALLQLYFNNVDHANVGDAAGIQNAATVGSIRVSLHTGDPGETGNQTTSEATYTSYARQLVARSTAGWTVSGNNVSNAALVTFPVATGGSDTVTHFGLGSDTTGVGNLYMSGVLDSSLAVSTNVQPEFAVNALDVDAD